MYMSTNGSINAQDPTWASHPEPHEEEAMSADGRVSLVCGLSRLLHDFGHQVLDGTRALALLTATLQHLTQLFEQHLLPRTQTHGFIALPSHPSDSAAILQAQFLFDVLQKTPSLKLVHPPKCIPRADVKLFPFKSLRCLKLQGVPLHCLQGLRAIYSQLEVLICSKCVTTLEEVISLCGGDLSSALPWLELHTLDFSYNSISCLDNSLQLLNILKILDLSHNQITDCASYLLPLTELVYLNLSYNFLRKVPLLSLGSRTQLASLILRNNDLDSINGVEQLSNLQHLDLAFNLLLQHTQLAPLAQLHRLRKLHLEGNPLSFHTAHRPSTVQHLSHKAVSENLFLDGELLSVSELAALPQSGQQAAQSWHASTPEGSGLDPSPLESSYTGDASDSASAGDSGAARLPRRKSKVKVRKASISEPRDAEHASRSRATEVILHHQQDIQRIDSFRDQFGEDWLQYRHHLENELSGSHKTEPPFSACHTPTDVPDTRVTAATPGTSTIQQQGRSKGTSSSPPPGDTAEQDKKPTGTDTVCEQEREEEASERRRQEERTREKRRREEQRDLHVDLCDPIVVCPFLGKDPDETENDWIFLRVTRRYLIEVDLSNAQDLQKLELVSLLNIETSDIVWKWKGEEKTLPLLQLQFDYISMDKKRLRYVVLDDTAEISVKTILHVLYPVLEANRNRIRRQSEEPVKLQCLKCRTEFRRPPTLVLGSGGLLSNEQPGARKEVCAGEEEVVTRAPLAECPSCTSDHVVILPSDWERAERRSSTPLSCDCLASDDLTKERASNLSSVDPFANNIAKDPRDPVMVASYPVPRPLPADSSDRFFIGREDDSSEVDTSNSSRTQEHSIEDEGDSTFHSSSRSSETDGAKSQDPKSHVAPRNPKDINCSSLTGSYRYGTSKVRTPPIAPPEPEETWHLSPPINDMLRMHDFRTVDHRLKLYLDMEVFEDTMEEFQCSLKVPVVQFGRDGEFSGLVVISEHRLYMMEITSDARGPPPHWLQKNATHQLSSLKHLEFGLWSQVLHLEFEKPRTSYSLLIRNQIRCDKFYQCFRDILDDLPLQYRCRFREEFKERVTYQHRLWPMLSEVLGTEEPPGLLTSPHYFYLLVYITQEGPSSSSTGSKACASAGLEGLNYASMDAACTQPQGMALAAAMIQHALIGSPVTLIITNTTMYLLEETHQWQYCPPYEYEVAGRYGDPTGGEARVKEKQPISSVSSLHLFRTADCHLQIRLYDETLKNETIWHVRSECPDLVRALVEWIRIPWEEMYRIKINCMMHEKLDG